MQKLCKWKACSTFPVLERKDKGRKLCLLSAKMATPFLSRCERFAFTGRQESMLDSRDRA